MKVDIWMPIYIGDYLRDTQELDGPEHGAYFLLLMHYWQKKGVIGDNVERLSKVARSSVEITAFILDNFFVLKGNNYINKRADQEIAKADTRSETARINVMKRWKKDTPVLPRYNGRNTDDDTESIRNGYSSSSSSSSSSNSPSKVNRAEVTSRNIFHPPTLEEVRAYCSERNKNVNPDKWHDFYTCKGWMVGKNKMKDWKAAVRTWEGNVKNQAGKQEQLGPSDEEIAKVMGFV